jgi:uncharacterized membrane protein
VTGAATVLVGAAAVGSGVMAGVLGVTALASVPLNERLRASTDPYWTEYRRRWTRWNHVRSAAALAAAAAYVAALVS